MGKQQQPELENRLRVLFKHLLKSAYWISEKEDNARGWKGIIKEQRKPRKRLEKKIPVLKLIDSKFWENVIKMRKKKTLKKQDYQPR